MNELKSIKDLEKMIEFILYMNENFCNIEYLYYDEDESEKDYREEKDDQEENDDEVYYTMAKKNNKPREKTGSTVIEIEEHLCIKRINCNLKSIIFF